MTDDDTMALLARVQWLEAENQRLIEHAAQAEADRDVLAAEVRAWRRTFDERTGKQIGDSSDCRDVSAARAVTDECGALTRATEAK
jgi:hypothetical protein